jgi:hypothetical protein
LGCGEILDGVLFERDSSVFLIKKQKKPRDSISLGFIFLFKKET